MEPLKQDNIVAFATPPGKSALAVIRFSGENLINIYKKLTKKNPKIRFAEFTKIYNPLNGQPLDEVIIIYYKSPNSYTGEDVIEISCHGGTSIKNSIINVAFKIGCRQADPGEFSMRAYLNGKLNLMQAEAVSHLISSNSTLSTSIGLKHLDGRVSSFLISLRSDVIKILSIIENELNFLEDEIEFSTKESIITKISDVKSSIKKILESSVLGKGALFGLRVVLYGKPNSGKSTLFNKILGHNRAITSEFAGTTRDSIEAYFEMKGVSICIIDTAGIWNSKKNLDLLGVENTKNELKKADVCIVLDPDNPKKLLNKTFSNFFSGEVILVQSKRDLGPIKHNSRQIISLSSITEEGISELLTSLSTIIENKYSTFDSNVLITKRQVFLLEQSLSFLSDAIEHVQSDVGLDVVASTLRSFVDCISETTGNISDVDIINNIFTEFCVGK